MVFFFLSLLKLKLPQACPKRVGGGTGGGNWSREEERDMELEVVDGIRGDSSVQVRWVQQPGVSLGRGEGGGDSEGERSLLFTLLTRWTLITVWERPALAPTGQNLKFFVF